MARSHFVALVAALAVCATLTGASARTLLQESPEYYDVELDGVAAAPAPGPDAVAAAPLAAASLEDSPSPVSSPSPVESPPAPVESPPAPVESPPTVSDASLESPPAPIESPPAPVESPPAPVESPPAPVESPPAPVESPPAPVESPPAPVESPPAPVESPPAPVESPPTPVESPPSPVEIAAASVATPSAWQYSGDGTAYSEAVSNGIGFACSYRTLASYFQTNFAAINSAQWDSGNNCGRCITATCIDAQCTNPSTVLVQIVDKCPECSYGDVDFSIPAYNVMTGLWPNRLTTAWSWEDTCGGEVTGTIQFDPKDGVNANWQAFYLSNAKYAVTSVALNGAPLTRSEFQFYINSGGAPSADSILSITSIFGETITVAIGDIFSSHDLGVNFS